MEEKVYGKVIDLEEVIQRLHDWVAEFTDEADPAAMRVSLLYVLDDFTRLVLQLDEEETRQALGGMVLMAIQGA